MILFVPGLTAGTVAHAAHMPMDQSSSMIMANCHEASRIDAVADDCCAGSAVSDQANPCAIACLSMAGTCMAPALPMGHLKLPVVAAFIALSIAADEPFASINGVPDTPPPKA